MFEKKSSPSKETSVPVCVHKKYFAVLSISQQNNGRYFRALFGDRFENGAGLENSIGVFGGVSVDADIEESRFLFEADGAGFGGDGCAFGARGYIIYSSACADRRSFGGIGGKGEGEVGERIQKAAVGDSESVEEFGADDCAGAGEAELLFYCFKAQCMSQSIIIRIYHESDFQCGRFFGLVKSPLIRRLSFGAQWLHTSVCAHRAPKLKPPSERQFDKPRQRGCAARCVFKLGFGLPILF